MSYFGSLTLQQKGEFQLINAQIILMATQSAIYKNRRRLGLEADEKFLKLSDILAKDIVLSITEFESLTNEVTDEINNILVNELEVEMLNDDRRN